MMYLLNRLLFKNGVGGLSCVVGFDRDLYVIAAVMAVCEF